MAINEREGRGGDRDRNDDLDKGGDDDRKGGRGRGGVDHPARHGLDGDRDVVLGRRALRPLGFGNRIADAPEGVRLRLARRDDGIVTQPARQRVGEQPLE